MSEESTQTTIDGLPRKYTNIHFPSRNQMESHQSAIRFHIQNEGVCRNRYVLDKSKPNVRCRCFAGIFCRFAFAPQIIQSSFQNSVLRDIRFKLIIPHKKTFAMDEILLQVIVKNYSPFQVILIFFNCRIEMFNPAFQQNFHLLQKNGNKDFEKGQTTGSQVRLIDRKIVSKRSSNSSC